MHSQPLHWLEAHDQLKTLASLLPGMRAHTVVARSCMDCSASLEMTGMRKFLVLARNQTLMNQPEASYFTMFHGVILT
jgi:hypothetical protein